MNQAYVERIQQAIHRIEHSGNDFLIDQAVWVLGFWKDVYPLDKWFKECPNMAALLPEMKEEPSRAKRLLLLMQWRDREDDLGEIADCIVKDNT